jgi:2-polyprenyl-3-methyl-5-hydroxy-6-metoxy-1,4-benzoquinol methylase
MSERVSRLPVFVTLWVWSACLALAQTPSSDEAMWKEFLGWLDVQQPNSKPVELIRAYKANLIRDGVPAVEAEQRMGVISKFIFTRHKGVELLWNKVYAGNNPIFIQTPTALVIGAVEGRRTGKALDVGMGQGRNSVFLAAQGWDITGFDPSDEGIRIARSNAEKTGVKIQAVVATDDEFDYGSNRWDLIVVTYVRDLNSDDAKRFWQALKCGGIVVYENGSDERNDVLRAFLDFRIVRFEDVEATPDWNTENKIRLQRLIAEKPAK